ncbi:MAG: DUF4234 domain-containing protein [Lachnospiraceae bacterium]|nr:DUF4234 domain-containing protein [Lachnospiraceae bacterium]
MKYCSNCGTPCEDSVNHCPQCGTAFKPQNPFSTAYGSTSDNASGNSCGNAQSGGAADSSAQSGGSTADSSAQSGSAGNSQANAQRYSYSNSDNNNYGYSGNYNGGNYSYGNGGNNYSQPHRPIITPRNIVLCILFSFITCGIYGIYWMIKLNDEINELANEPNATSGGMVFLFTVITCGIYGLYWMYKMGERVDRINGVNGNSNILYMLVSLFGFSIVSYCLMQDTVNRHCGSGMM